MNTFVRPTALLTWNKTEKTYFNTNIVSCPFITSFKPSISGCRVDLNEGRRLVLCCIILNKFKYNAPLLKSIETVSRKDSEIMGWPVLGISSLLRNNKDGKDDRKGRKQHAEKCHMFLQARLLGMPTKNDGAIRQLLIRITLKTRKENLKP